jgi:hypothetical protein
VRMLGIRTMRRCRLAPRQLPGRTGGPTIATGSAAEGSGGDERAVAALHACATSRRLKQVTPAEVFPGQHEQIAQHFVFGTLERHGVRCRMPFPQCRSTA